MKRRDFIKYNTIASVAIPATVGILSRGTKVYDHIYVGDMDTYWLEEGGISLQCTGDAFLYCKKSECKIGINDLWLDNLKGISDITAWCNYETT